MNIEDKRSLLLQRRETLDNEITDMQEEITILFALIKKTEEEIEAIQTKLGELEMLKRNKLAYAS